MSIQRTTRLRSFITAQKCRYHPHPSYPPRESPISPQRAIHTQSTVPFLPAHVPATLAVHRPRLATPMSPYLCAQSINGPSSSRLVYRSFATAAGDVAGSGTSRTAALLVAAPKPEEMDPDEEVELLSPDEAHVQLTERAAEVRASYISTFGA